MQAGLVKASQRSANTSLQCLPANLVLSSIRHRHLCLSLPLPVLAEQLEGIGFVLSARITV